MAEQADGPWVRYEDVEKLQGIATKEQLAEAVTVGRLPLLQTIKDLEAQVKVLREDKEGGLPHFEVNVPMPPVKAAKVEGGVKRFGEVTESEILFGMKGVVESDDGDYMLFDDHINASMEVVELASWNPKSGKPEKVPTRTESVSPAWSVCFTGCSVHRWTRTTSMNSWRWSRLLRVNQNPCGNCGS
jgi:hypothetical protein